VVEVILRKAEEIRKAAGATALREERGRAFAVCPIAYRERSLAPWERSANPEFVVETRELPVHRER